MSESYSTVDNPPVRTRNTEMLRICRGIPLDLWSLHFAACFISLLFATHSEATSQCNFPVYGGSFASVIPALEVKYRRRPQPHIVFFLHLNHLIYITIRGWQCYSCYFKPCVNSRQRKNLQRFYIK